MIKMLDFDPSLVPDSTPEAAAQPAPGPDQSTDITMELTLSPEPVPVKDSIEYGSDSPEAKTENAGLGGWIVASLLSLALLAGWAYVIKDTRESQAVTRQLTQEIRTLTAELDLERDARRRAEAAAEINAQVAAGILRGDELQAAPGSPPPAQPIEQAPPADAE